MSTGSVDNWLNVDQFGAIYPFVGAEMFLAFIGIMFWIAWHILQVRKENIEFSADIKSIKERGGVDKVLEEEAKREMQDAVGR